MFFGVAFPNLNPNPNLNLFIWIETKLRSPSRPQPQKTAALAPNRTKSHQIAAKKFLCMAKKSHFGAFGTPFPAIVSPTAGGAEKPSP
jgi:hypothetical protein